MEGEGGEPREFVITGWLVCSEVSRYRRRLLLGLGFIDHEATLGMLSAMVKGPVLKASLPNLLQLA